MIWKIVGRILAEHLPLHLLVPLGVGSFFNAIATHYLKKHAWSWVWSDLVARDNLLLAAGVTVTYLVIIYYQTRKETSTPIRANDLAVLADELTSASSYFATAAIGLKEWFDPVSQVVLSSIVKKKITTPGFRDERVLLFARERDIRASELPYLDGYYAQRLAYIHQNYQTQLAFLKPKEIGTVLSQLSTKSQDVLHVYPWWLVWKPESLLKKLPLWVLRVRRFDFALIKRADDSKSVLLVSKESESLQVLAIKEDSKIAAYSELVDLIQRCIHKPGTTPPEIDPAHDFIRGHILG